MGSSGKILLTLSLVAVLIGGAKVFLSQGGRTWMAARDLPANRRLERSDFRCPPGRQPALLPAPEDLTGRYLVRSLHRGEAIAAKDVRERPDLTPPAGRVVVFYRLESGRPETSAPVEVRSRVRVCSATARLPEGSGKRYCTPAVSVLAVYRTADDQSGWLALSAPEPLSEPISAVVASPDRFLEIEGGSGL
jgi:hypothetical protein